ncbi:hypothetical protein ACQPZJ_35370 [Actinoplanes sp. CA-054009]
MNEDVKKRWITRLRSGQDEQATSYLRTDEGMCCLGVLTEIAVEDGVIDPPEAECGIFYYSGYEKHTLPGPVARWGGLTHDNPTVTAVVTQRNGIVLDRPEEVTVPIAELNDLHGYTFPMLADVIESQL